MSQMVIPCFATVCILTKITEYSSSSRRNLEIDTKSSTVGVLANRRHNKFFML